MAEAIARHLIAARNRTDIEVASAGTQASTARSDAKAASGRRKAMGIVRAPESAEGKDGSGATGATLRALCHR